MTIQLLTLIALWCGNPITHNPYGSGPDITVKDVQECREQFMQCLSNPPEIMRDNENVTRCTKLIKQPGKDQ